MSSKRKIQKQYNYANRDKTHSRNRLIHFIRRFYERHKISISLANLDSFKEQIRVGKALLVKINKDGSKEYIVKLAVSNSEIRDIVIIVKKDHEKLTWITTYPAEQKHFDLANNRFKKIREKRRKTRLRNKYKIKERDIVGFMDFTKYFSYAILFVYILSLIILVGVM